MNREDKITLAYMALPFVAFGLLVTLYHCGVL